MKIDGQILCGMVISAANALDNNKEVVNNMNVFPVPDGDTGINMTLTLTSVRALAGMTGSVSECADKVANAALRSARGNSGAILSLFFRGFAKAFKGIDRASCKDIAAALKKGTEEAYRAVMKPTEGTILTVMRVCAEEAQKKVGKKPYKDDPAELFALVYRVGQETLAKTPEMLPVLKEANVVDAGGYGFLFVIEGMLSALRGKPVEATESSEDAAPSEASFADFDTESIEFAYCTECIVAKSPAFMGEGTASEFYEMICGIGDSAVFVDAEDLIKVHIHTNHPGLVIEKALEFGEIETMKVENMRRQHSTLVSKSTDKNKPNEAPIQPKKDAIEKDFGFVSICMGKGIRDTFIDLGVDQIVYGGQTMNPSTQDILNGIEKTSAHTVYVLPNNKNIYLVACQAAELVTDKKVIVMNTRSVPQGISAMIGFNPDADVETNTASMNEAIANVRTAQVTYAVRDTSIEGIEIKNGQTLVLVDGKIIRAVDTQEEYITAIAEEFADASYLTVFYGASISDERAEKAVALLRSKIGEAAEIVTISGGQPIYDYIISAE